MVQEIKVGDLVTRRFAGLVQVKPMQLKVTAVSDKHIVCGPWKFDKVTGREIDDEISVLVSAIDLNTVITA